MSGSMKKQAYQHILQKMMRGELAPGMQISELSVAAELGVSRSPVRDALGQMVSEGMVERVPRFGTVIKKFSIQEVSDLYDLRVALESYAAEQAATRISPAMLASLEEACDGLKKISQTLQSSGEGELAPDLLGEMSRLDMSFHLAILRATGNRLLFKSAYESRIMSRIFGMSRVVSFDQEYVDGVYRYHSDIFNAIRNGEPSVARAMMARHINFGKEGALKYMTVNQSRQAQAEFDSIEENLVHATADIEG